MSLYRSLAGWGLRVTPRTELIPNQALQTVMVIWASEGWLTKLLVGHDWGFPVSHDYQPPFPFKRAHIHQSQHLKCPRPR